MGMPVIQASGVTRDDAVTDLIESVALEEAALAHIMNAEGEKMQAIIQMNDVTPEDLLTLNKSVEQTVNAIMRLEMMLQAKLELVASDDSTVTTR